MTSSGRTIGECRHGVKAWDCEICQLQGENATLRAQLADYRTAAGAEAKAGDEARAELASLRTTYLAECDRQDTQFQEIERLTGQLAAAEELLRQCCRDYTFADTNHDEIDTFLNNLKGGA